MKITVSTMSPCDADSLFRLSQDYSRRLEWDDYLVEAKLLGPGEVAAVGVDVHCRNRRGQVMVSRYVSYKPPLVAAVSMVKGPAILASFTGSWRFVVQPDGTTRIVFTYNFRTSPWWLGPVIEPLVAWVYKRQMQRRIDAFARWATSCCAPPGLTAEGLSSHEAPTRQQPVL
jgi:hypothetical protein